MNTRFVLLLALFFCMNSLSPLSAQTLYYDVLKGTSPIGTLTVTRLDTDSATTQYVAETHLSFRVIKKFEAHSVYKSVLKHGKLTYAHTQTLLDGKERESSEVIWNGRFYACQQDGKQRTRYEPIVESVVKLYFSEPTHVSETFSERFADDCKITPAQQAHTYLLHLPDGKANQYTYRHGLCQEVKVDLFWGTIYFRLREVKGAAVQTPKVAKSTY